MDKVLFELYKSIKQMEKRYNEMIDEFNAMAKLLNHSEKQKFLKMIGYFACKNSLMLYDNLLKLRKDLEK